MLGSHVDFVQNLWGQILRLNKTKKIEAICRDKAIGTLKFLGIDKYKDSLPTQLSTGHLRLVDVARAMVGNPAVLMLDEPASGLTFDETERLTHTIKSICQQWGTTILIIEHNIPLVISLADNIIVLNFGEKIAEGTPVEISQNQSVIDAYLGENVHDLETK